jgi:hypothetical protein
MLNPPNGPTHTVINRQRNPQRHSIATEPAQLLLKVSDNDEYVVNRNLSPVGPGVRVSAYQDKQHPNGRFSLQEALQKAQELLNKRPK